MGELERRSAMPSGFVLFTKPGCKYCKAAKALLALLGHSFSERDISEQAVRVEMQLRAAGAKTVPQVFKDGRHMGGFEDLHRSLGCSIEAPEFVRQVLDAESTATTTGTTESCSS